MTERALWVAKTGLDAQQTRMAVIQDVIYDVSNGVVCIRRHSFFYKLKEISLKTFNGNIGNKV